MPKIQSINIYPIKGMRGISVTSAQLRPEGLEHDRRWMLVDKAGTFISQRTHPLMALFLTSIVNNNLEISYKGEQLIIPIDEMTDENINVSVFEDKMQATVVSEKSSAWFSKQLNTACHLVKVSSITNRIKDYSKYRSAPDSTNKTVVSFADGYPYLLLGSASMDFLNDKMEAPLSIDRFRANIIVETSNPHEEDEWERIQIGDQQLLVIKPCARCQVPTVDQRTGNKGKEPNKTLSTYRRIGNKVNFGMNAVSLSHGRIAVGDDVI